ncbi:MAG TPA: tyrosine-type recombinase/integrase, partial [Pedococcus sp.]|uniref:tyrosine-type recombinase/integrase n=1 Tax=Pedococcus sp. TaxID=2860345 RepID=UPI002F95FA86
DAGWKAACDLVDKPGLRPHDLRHTAATAWLRITGDMKAVQTLLGHATASMTLDLYSHLLNDSVTRAASLPRRLRARDGLASRGLRSWRCGRSGNLHDSDLRFCNGRGDRI